MTCVFVIYIFIKINVQSNFYRANSFTIREIRDNDKRYSLILLSAKIN